MSYIYTLCQQITLTCARVCVCACAWISEYEGLHVYMDVHVSVCLCVRAHMCVRWRAHSWWLCKNPFNWRIRPHWQVGARKIFGGNYRIANARWQMMGGKCHRSVQCRLSYPCYTPYPHPALILPSHVQPCPHANHLNLQSLPNNSSLTPIPH